MTLQFGAGMHRLWVPSTALQAEVKPLADMLKDTTQSDTLRSAALQVLGSIGRGAKEAVEPLVRIVQNTTESDSLRREAAEALGGIGGGDREAVRHLSEVLEDPAQDDILRRDVAEALGAIGSSAGEAVGPLVRIVQNTTESDGLRREAVEALGAIGPRKAIEPLVKVVQDTSESDDLRTQSVRALGRIGPGAVDALTDEVLDNSTLSDNLRGSAAGALERIGPAAEDAARPLAKVLKDSTESDDLRIQSIRALGRIGAETDEELWPLIKVLKGTSKHNLQSVNIRSEAAKALGAIGPVDPEKAIGPLLAVLRDSTETLPLRGSAVTGLIQFAETLVREEHTPSPGLLSDLEDAHDYVRQISKYRPTVDADRLRSSITGLRNIRRASWRVWLAEKVIKSVSENRYIVIIGAFYLLLLCIWLAILGLRPIWVLGANRTLRQIEGHLSLGMVHPSLSAIKIPLRHVLLVGFFHHHSRVLDAWVEHYLSKARDRFRKSETVKERKIHISLPVEMEGQLLERLEPADLQSTFSRNNAFVLIHGEGGAGKTSLACRLARSAMHEDPERRLCESHRLLPVLIESGFTDFTEAVHARLRYLVGAERSLPSDLVEALLRKRRVLVIVDGLSERSSETREAFQLGTKDFPANALMVTSRIEEPLGNVLKTVLRPLRVEGNRVSDFMSAYLRKRGKREHFPDSVFFDMLSHFSEMVGDRPIPVLLPRLYAEEMIAAREAGSDDLPANIPDLVLRYLNQVNPADPYDNRTVHRVAKRLAWLCLREDFRPSEASLEAVNEILSDDELDVATYLEDRMRILRTVKPAEDRVRFTLDPVAEYLAALHKTDALNGDEEAWWQFLRRVDDLEGEPKATRGFLQAMDDCCRHPDFRDTVPDWVPGQLADHAALEAEPARV